MAVAEGKQQLVEVLRTACVADEDACLGQRSEMEEPEPVARKIDEVVPSVSLDLGASGTGVRELDRDQGVSPAGNPRKAVAVRSDRLLQLAESPLGPTDRNHVREAEHVVRVEALTHPRDLERVSREAFGVCKPSLDRRLDDTQTDDVPEEERLAGALRKLRHGRERRRRARSVTELEQAIEARTVRQEGKLAVPRVARDRRAPCDV